MNPTKITIIRSAKRKKTIAFNTGIEESHIISAEDVASIYEIPLLFKSQDFDKKLYWARS